MTLKTYSLLIHKIHLRPILIADSWFMWQSGLDGEGWEVSEISKDQRVLQGSGAGGMCR